MNRKTVRQSSLNKVRDSRRIRDTFGEIKSVSDSRRVKDNGADRFAFQCYVFNKRGFTGETYINYNKIAYPNESECEDAAIKKAEELFERCKNDNPTEVYVEIYKNSEDFEQFKIFKKGNSFVMGKITNYKFDREIVNG